MRTLLLVFAIALIAPSLFAQQQTAPPAAQKDPGKDQVQDQVPDKDQGKVPVFRKNVTGDLNLLRGGFNKARINTNTVGMSAMGGPGPVPTAGGQNKGTLLFDAVYLAADEVLSRQVGRKAMIILTDGEDVGSKLRLK